MVSIYSGNPNTEREIQGNFVIFGQKLRTILLMKVCGVRKYWKARVLGAERSAAETDFRRDSRSKCRKTRRLSLGTLWKETTPFLPPWKVLNVGRTSFQMDFFPEAVASHKKFLI